MSRVAALTPLFDRELQFGATLVGSTPGIPPPPPRGVWVRDDRYFPGNQAGRTLAIPTTNAVVQVTNWTALLIANYGKLNLIATADATGVQDVLRLPDQTTRRLWGATCAAGTKLAVAGHSYDNAESSVPARLYDLSDPSNITLITNKSVGPFGIGSGQMPLMGGCLDPNNVFWFPHLSGGTTRIVGSDFDTANVTDYGPFNLSHSVIVISSSIIDTMWLNGGVYYGAIAGRQTISIFSTAGVVGSVAMGVGASSANNSVNLVSPTLLLVNLLDNGTTPKVVAINITTPSAPTVAWTWSPGHSVQFVGCPDANTAIFATSGLTPNRWEWLDLTTHTVTHQLDYDSSGFATGGHLLADGSIAAYGYDNGEGDGIVFVADPINQPTPNRTASPRPWRTTVTEPSTGLGTAIIKWDSRLLSSVAAGATFPNTGSAGSIFDLKIVDGGAGNALYAKKNVNWPSTVDFGPNTTLPSESDFGGDWSNGPLCLIYALPAGHRTFESSGPGFIEVDVIPGDGGAYDFVGMTAEGFAFGGGFAGLYGAANGLSINDGTFYETYWDETLTNPLMDRDIDLLVAIYIDPASRSFATWIVDNVGVHTVTHQTDKYDGADADEYSFTNGLWPNPEFDSQGTTAANVFLFFGATLSPATALTAWDGVVWAGLYRGRPSTSELLALYASSF